MKHIFRPSPSEGEGSPNFEGKDHDAGLSIILVDAGPGNGPRLHRHDYEEVFVVQQGTVTFTVGDVQLEAHPGDVAVVPAGVPHGFVNSGSEQLRMTAVHHSPEFVTDWLG
jgi:mannose-6-phosphate isomerase-like protein (cupin superfamily)